MAATTPESSKPNPNSVAEIFKNMNYGPAPEADNVVKVCYLLYCCHVFINVHKMFVCVELNLELT